jgi:hypothetical protein
MGHLPVISELVQPVSLRRELWQIDVSSGNAGTTHPHGTHFSHCDWILILVQYIYCGVWYRLAYGQKLTRDVWVGRIKDGDLCRAADIVVVRVDCPIVGKTGLQLVRLIIEL